MKGALEDLVEIPPIDLAALVSSPDAVTLERAIAHGTRSMLRKIDPAICARVLDEVARFRGEASTPADTIQRALQLAHAVRSVLRLQSAAQSLETGDPRCSSNR